MAQVGEIVAVDEAAFSRVVAPNASLRKLGEGFRFIEGPVWSSQDGGYLLFSDIPANRIYRWREGQAPEIWRENSNSANGNTRDREGRLITCQHGTRTLTRTDPQTGQVETLAERYEGKRLNSPNDAVVKSDGTIWFTDPPYGLKGGKEGKELEQNATYCLNPETGELRIVDSTLSMPNGLCFSPDEKKLYIAESDWRIHEVHVFDVGDDNTLSNGRRLCTIEPGVPDGMRVDAEGRLYSSAGDGVHVYAPDGTLIGKILTPLVPDVKDPTRQRRQTVTNLCFGGPENRTLFMTATTTLYSVDLKVAGAVRH